MIPRSPNPEMIHADQAGIPGKRKPFPDGRWIATRKQ
jgi:hypothetical protein